MGHTPLSLRFDNLCRMSIRRQILVLSIVSISVFVLLWIAWILCCYGFYNGIYVLFSEERIFKEEGLPGLYDVFLQAVNPSKEFIQGGGSLSVLGIITFLIGSFLITGLSVTLLVNWVDRRKEQWNAGETRYNIKKDFTIILGGKRMIVDLCDQILSKMGKSHYVIILTNSNIDMLRKQILSNLGECNRILIYRGDQTSKEDLMTLNIYGAKEIYVIGDENDEEEVCDSHNMESVITIDEIIEKHDNEKIACHVMLNSFLSSRTLLNSDIKLRNLDFIPFNYYESWAKAVITDCGGDYGYLPLDGNKDEGFISKDCCKGVHLIVLGVTQLSVAVALEAAKTCHYPNFCTKGIKTRITFVDLSVEEFMYDIFNRYPYLFALSHVHTMTKSEIGEETNVNYLTKFLDLEWEFIKGDINSPKIRKWLTKRVGDSSRIVTLVVGNKDINKSTTIALTLPKDVYSAHEILVEYRESPILWKCILERSINGEDEMYSRIKPFGMLNLCKYIDWNDNWLAKAVNGFYNGLKFNDALGADVFFSRISKDWTNINSSNGKTIMAKKWSCIGSASSIPIKCRCFNITETSVLNEDDLELLSQVEHNRWSIEQLVMGFRPPEESEVDPIRKGSSEDIKKFIQRGVHPYIIPYNMLPDKIQRIDRAIIKYIPKLLMFKSRLDDNIYY